MIRKPPKPITQRAIAAIHSFYAPAFGREAPEIPKARAKSQKRIYSPLEPSESEILKAIMKLLKYHPKVARVWRQNSGTFQMQYGDKTRYIRANTARGMSDIMGILNDGRTLAVEVKTRIGKVEQHQWDFLKSINDAGGIAGVCRSVGDAIKLLDGV